MSPFWDSFLGIPFGSPFCESFGSSFAVCTRIFLQKIFNLLIDDMRANIEAN